jgi:hypothetical protein
MKQTADNDFKVIMAILFLLITATTVALWNIKVPREMVNLANNPSPYGYTWSLVLFYLPIAAVLFWIHTHADFKLPRTAFYCTVIPLVLLGFGLDFFLGTLFFNFPNEAATIGFWLPAWDWTMHRIVPHLIPVEEFIFYGGSCPFVLLIYLWCDEYWCGAYKVTDYRAASHHIGRMIQLRGGPIVLGVTLILVAWFYKKFGPTEFHQGFPAYWTFLVAVAIIPSTFLLGATKSLINWRAFSFAILLLVLISVMWEATLAIPYGWWGYEKTWMIGIFVGAWTQLPIEAIALWISATFATVIIYEAVKIFLATDRPKREMLLGKR